MSPAGPHLGRCRIGARLSVGLLLAALAWAPLCPAAAPAPGEPTALHGWLVQDLLPELAARSMAAEARSEAAQAWFQGSGSLEDAFPELVSAPLADPAWLATASWRLQRRARERAAERVQAHPRGAEALSATDLARWQSAREQVCQEEERADAYERRLLAGLQSALERAPGLADGEVAPLQEYWRSLRAPASQPEASEEQLTLAAAAGAAEAALLDLRRAAWRAAAIPGDAALATRVEAEIATPIPRVWPQDAGAVLDLQTRADRLQRVQPLLTRSQAQRAQSAVEATETLRLSSRIEQLRAEATALAAAGPPSSGGLRLQLLEQRVHSLEVEQTTAETALAALPPAQPDSTGASALRREALQLRGWLAQTRLAAAREALQRAQHRSASGLDDGLDEADVSEARRKANEAHERAQDESERASQAEATLRLQLAKLRRAFADQVETESTRRKAAAANIEQLQDRLQALADSLAAATALPPLDPQRTARIDDSYRELRQLVDDLRAERDLKAQQISGLGTSARQGLEALQSATPQPQPGVTSEVISSLLAENASAGADLEGAYESPQQAADAELAALGDLLLQAKRARRKARRVASPQARQVVGETYLPELADELGEVPHQLVDWNRQAGLGLRQLPSRMLDLGAISSLLYGSLGLLVLVVLWLWIRRRLPQWLAQLVQAVDEAGRNHRAHPILRSLAEAWRRWLEPGDRILLQAALTGFSACALDLLALLVLAVRLDDGPPVLAWLLWLAAAVAAWRLLPHLLELLVATPKERRPALRRVEPATRQLLSRTARWLLAWWLVLTLLERATLQLLQADRLTELVHGLGGLAFWALAALLIMRWSPAVLAAFASEARAGRLSSWIVRPGSNRVSTFLKSVLALGGLLLRWVQGLGAVVLHRQRRLAWLGTIIARRQLRDAPAAPARPLDATVRRRLDTVRRPLPGLDDHARRLSKLHIEWLQDHRRGVVGLVGDRGMGKREVLDRLGHSLNGRPLLRLRPVAPMLDRDETLRWLADSAGVPLGEREATVSTVANRLTELTDSPRVLVLEDLQLLFQRSVGGFKALRAVLDTVHETSDDHFWIAVIHRPTWGYLKGVPGAFNAAAFRELVMMEPVESEQLEAWLAGIAEQARVSLSFQRLSRLPAGSIGEQRERQRAARAYWRLLHDRAAGNPQVARELWFEGLGAGDDSGTVEAALARAPVPSDLSDLQDAELFVLTALVVHEQLDVARAARVLNMPEPGVRATCRRLEARQVLVGDEALDCFHVRTRWLPAVQRTLRAKNFLYGR